MECVCQNVLFQNSSKFPPIFNGVMSQVARRKPARLKLDLGKLAHLKLASLKPARPKLARLHNDYTITVV